MHLHLSNLCQRGGQHRKIPHGIIAGILVHGFVQFVHSDLQPVCRVPEKTGIGNGENYRIQLRIRTEIHRIGGEPELDEQMRTDGAEQRILNPSENLCAHLACPDGILRN